MDRLRDLNAAQREAVLTLSNPLLVLAGAGTGKTRVITFRTAELIRRGTRPDRVLSVTFTNKAAREMAQRTVSLLGRRLQAKPLVCTFHALCVRILRQEISALGYPLNFSIYDRGDQETVARKALREIRVNEKALRPGDLLAHISRWKTAGLGPPQAAQTADSDEGQLAAVAYRRYQSKLRAGGAVDFDDLLRLTNQLFDEFPDTLKRHQQRFDHVQIDEYQDTNDAQFRIVEALVRPHRNLCVVGDDDQSIYGWRGAQVDHILNFQAYFPGAKVVRLEDNYRCTGPILELANRLVGHNPGRYPKRLVSHKRSGAAVRSLRFPDETSEAESIAREIAARIAGKRVRARDIAILFRTNEQPRLFETELRRTNTPYVLIGGQSFFDRREIRDLLAYLKVLAHADDEASLLRIINTPPRGIGPSTLETLIAAAVKQRVGLWKVVPQAAAAGDIAARAARSLADFRALLDRFRTRFKQSPRRMAQLTRELIEAIGYESEIENQYKDPAQQAARLAVLEEFVETVGEYARRSDKPTLEGFLQESALRDRDEEPDKDDRLREEAVRLMTLHSAKGLEFPIVYLVGLEEGLLPHKRSLEQENGHGIAEERRLAYVGITRAMDELTLSRAETRRKWGKPRPALPSRFLFEMHALTEPAAENEAGNMADAGEALQ